MSALYFVFDISDLSDYIDIMDRTSNITKRRMPMRTTHWTIRNFPVELHKQAKMKAVEQEITLKELVIRALTEYLKKVGG